MLYKNKLKEGILSNDNENPEKKKVLQLKLWRFNDRSQWKTCIYVYKVFERKKKLKKSGSSLMNT